MISAKTVDDYIERAADWKELLHVLRTILMDCQLDETVKWGAPIYTVNGKNVVGMAAFKAHVSLWFHQGVFMKDEHSVLINASEGVTKGQRQWRFKSLEEIIPENVRTYVMEARENALNGKSIKPARKKLELSEEFAQALESDHHLKLAFDALSRGKQVEYAEHIGSAKQDATRISRMRKCIPMILEGKGLNDRYR